MLPDLIAHPLQTDGPEQAQHMHGALVDMTMPSTQGQPAFCNIRVRQDYFGVQRFVTASRCGSSSRAGASP
jgi:hypothetical protein